MSDPTPEPTAELPPADPAPAEFMPPVVPATSGIASTPTVVASTPAPSSGHTRTILEVIGGVVAVGLIVLAGGVGFLIGHATASDDGEHFGMMRGFISRGDGMPMDPRGLDPRGDEGGEPFGR